MTRLAWLAVFIAITALGQSDRGELRLIVTDPSGAAVRTTVQVSSAHNGYVQSLSTDDAGVLDVRHLAFGMYAVQMSPSGFAPYATTISIGTELPITRTIRLQVAPLQTHVNVSASTLLDRDAASTPRTLGREQISDRLTSLPGRSLQDLVVSQPGWIYEGNAVLHPRGSEYQTEIVLDGIPLTDNHSPGFGPALDAGDIDTMTIYTAGIPAEFGRKLGGVITVDTQRQTNPGFHGQADLYGGSYNTTGGSASVGYTWTKNTLTANGAGARTDYYLNPVVPQNYTNSGATGEFALSDAADLSANDRLRVSIRHEFSRYLIPNELIQQQADQIQNADNIETIGTVGYQHLFSPKALFTVSGMGRENANDLGSNTNPIPIAAFQHNWFREGYVRASYNVQRGAHDLKAGIESDNIALHENFSYSVTDPTFFDQATPTTLPAFAAHGLDLEQSAFIQDNARLRSWTISAGLRWDHYQLLLNQNALSSRLSIGRYIARGALLLHASFDRVFITPSFENILISSSPDASALDYPFLHLPVKSSRGNYYEGGASHVFVDHVRLDANIYRRDFRNFADDDQLLNTAVSYPIAFDRAVIYGAEGKLTIDHLGPWSGFASYSYMVGNVWAPVTGGLFLGDDASNAVSQLSGHFPNSQDQRNTLNMLFRYQPHRRFWLAAGQSFGSGLPFEYQGPEATALAEYGAAVIDRVNFDRGRIRPNLSINASAGIDLHASDRWGLTLQADGRNLNNRLNVIDFGGLFSGNAIAPARSAMLRMHTWF